MMSEQPYFLLLATDADHTAEARRAARPAHLARLEQLQRENRLLTAGPTPLPENSNEVSGSVIIARFDSLDDAQAWAEQDPYVEAGVYSEILIRPYNPVFK